MSHFLSFVDTYRSLDCAASYAAGVEARLDVQRPASGASAAARNRRCR